jgi:predicted nucleic acid-binding protein
VALVLDTGVLYAALYSDDPDHAACAGLIEASTEQLVIPQMVLVELDYWITRAASLEVWLSFCEDVARGAYLLWPLDRDLLVRAAGLQLRFADQSIGLVDAAVFVTCEALGETKVATLDARHFGVLAPEGGAPLQILPERVI